MGGVSRGQLGGDGGAEAVAEQVDLAQAHGREEIADGRGMLRDPRTGRWRVGIPEAGQIGGENRACRPGNREESAKNPPGVGDGVQAEERSALLEPAAGRNGVVDVQLAVAAFEIAAPEPRLRCRRGA